jgi:hypothetical protein
MKGHIKMVDLSTAATVIILPHTSTSSWFTKDVTGAVCECMYDVCVFVCMSVYMYLCMQAQAYGS